MSDVMTSRWLYCSFDAIVKMDGDVPVLYKRNGDLKPENLKRILDMTGLEIDINKSGEGVIYLKERNDGKANS